MKLFDLGDLRVLKNGTRKHFENDLKSMQIFQRLMGGMDRWGRSHLNQISSAVRSDSSKVLSLDSFNSLESLKRRACNKMVCIWGYALINS